jgi:hypothetical protein
MEPEVLLLEICVSEYEGPDSLHHAVDKSVEYNFPYSDIKNPHLQDVLLLYEMSLN